jgi:plastocyanin
MVKHISGHSGRIRFLWVALSLATLATLLLVACGGTTTTTSSPTATTAPTATPTPLPATIPLGAVIVKMVEKTPGDYVFDPASITIKAGTVIVWINESDGMHTVTSDPGAPSAFNTTSNVTQGRTFALMFTTPGTYHYRCTIHPKTMQAIITVTA